MAGYIGSKAAVVSSGVERKKTYSITGSTTSLTGLNYTVGKVHVYQNGVRLLDGTDYTATNGTSITLTVAAQSGDNVVVVSQASFQLSEHYTSAEADAEFVTKTGDTMSGNLNITGTVTADGLTVDGAYSQSKASGTFFTLTDTTNSKTGYINWDSGNWGIFTHGPYKRLNIADNGDISFYEDTGTTAKFFWDASAESLGIGSSTIYGNGGSTLSLSDDLGGNVGGRLALHYTGNSGYAQISTSNANDVVIDADRTNVGSNTNIQFRIDNTERMRIDSSGNVGIGTSSPSATIDVVSSGTNSQSLAEFSSASGLRAKIASDGGDDGYMYLYDANDANTVSFRTDGNHSFINGGGNFGIGTSSPSAKLEVAGNVKLGAVNPMQTATNVVHGTSGQNGFSIRTAVSGATTPTYSNVDDTNTGMFFPVADTLGFSTAGTERMRIDSSGNLLVGKTSTESMGSATAGHTFYGSGTARHTVNNGEVMNINRLNSDGDIIGFYKNGTTVGSISVWNGHIGLVQGGTRLEIDDGNDAVFFTNNSVGGLRDGTTDLGKTNARLKDVHAVNYYGDGSNLTGLSGGGIGSSQSWSAQSKTPDTVYQNTSGGPIMVAVSAEGNISTGYMQVSSNNSTWIIAGAYDNFAYSASSIVVPDNHYYKVTGVQYSDDTWAELS